MSHALPSAHAWPGAAAFVAMWTAMMVVMMLPSLAPALRGCYRMVGRPGAMVRPGRSAAAMAAGYYAVWIVVGVALLPLRGAPARRARHRCGAPAARVRDGDRRDVIGLDGERGAGAHGRAVASPCWIA